MLTIAGFLAKFTGAERDDRAIAVARASGKTSDPAERKRQEWEAIERSVDELVAGGHGERFDANKGTPMKEWFSLDPESDLAWPPLAREALDFARGA